jgi:hypothetical protein
MSSIEEFVSEHWGKIEDFPVPVDTLIEETRRKEAISAAVAVSLGQKDRHGVKFTEVERLLRLLKKTTDPLTLAALFEKVHTIEHNIRPELQQIIVIMSLVDIAGEVIAKLYVLALPIDDLPNFLQQQSIPEFPEIEEELVQLLSGPQVIGTLRTSFKASGYDMPQPKINSRQRETIDLIRDTIEELFFPEE